MATLEKGRLTQIVRQCDMATGGGNDPLSEDMMAEICSLATPFTKWHAKWHTGDDGSPELAIYNMDTGPDAHKASGAKFWPRADHDTDAALDLLAKLVSQPYRLDVTILEGDEARSVDGALLLNDNPMARLQKVVDGHLFDLSCQAAVLPLAIVGVALKAYTVEQAAKSRQAEPEDDLPPMDDLPPPDSDDPLPSFEDLPA